MKEKIIEESIKSLQNEGLKFSVDTLAEKLKISKKTVYKYFPSKETLALELYRQYYITADNKAKRLLKEKGDTLIFDLLMLYYESKKMTGKEIFNKYKLNEIIRSFAEKQSDNIWDALNSAMNITADESEIIKTIVDGAFEKLFENKLSPKAIIKRLANLI